MLWGTGEKVHSRLVKQNIFGCAEVAGSSELSMFRAKSGSRVRASGSNGRASAPFVPGFSCILALGWNFLEQVLNTFGGSFSIARLTIALERDA